MASKNILNKRIDFYSVIGYVCIVIIFVGLMSIGMRLTGNAVTTSTGVVNASVNSMISINFSSNFINFGSGSVNSGQSSATLESNGTSATTGSWTWAKSNFTVVNIGNGNVSLNLKTGKSADTFLGGTSPQYNYSILEVEANSCTGGVTLSAWYPVNTTDPGTPICANFPFTDNYDTIAINVRLVIPSDSYTGNLTDTFTATGTG